MKNGTRSPRKIEELAARIDEDLVGRFPWVLEYGPALTAYGRAEAVARMLFREVMSGGVHDRRTGRVREGILSRYNAAENTASRLREKLCLTPGSEAQLARDRAAAASLALSVDLETLASRGDAANEARMRRPDLLVTVLEEERISLAREGTEAETHSDAEPTTLLDTDDEEGSA